MKIQERGSYFWTSYSDMMTSLFFVMLVLFVLTVALLHKGLVATKGQLEQIERLNKSIERIDERYFTYDEENQRHTLNNVEASFKKNSSNIYDISDEDRNRLLDAGKAIQTFLNNAREDRDLEQAQYLLIVEGQSSKDDYSRNYELSYERALALVRFWEKNGVEFDNSQCEVIISGSGCASRFRVKPELINENGHVRSNPKNQRFVIHMIPKPGKFGKK